MAQYIIDTDVEIYGKGCYPFPLMKEYDSVLIPAVSAENAIAASRNFARRHNLRFVTRAEGRDVRIWRVPLDYIASGKALAPVKFAVDRNIPIPPIKRAANRKYPFRDLEVGDSFTLPNSRARGLRLSAKSFERRNSWKFRIEKTETHHRLWRVE